MKIQAFNDYIGVVELESKKGTLVVSDCVGLEKVEVVSINSVTSKWLCESQGEYIQEGSILYIKVDDKPEPYILVDGKKVFFIEETRIVAVDPSTTPVPDMPKKEAENLTVK